MPTGAEDRPHPLPSTESLEPCLSRLLGSPGFLRSARLRRFVRYTVEATLEGRSDHIKEYVLGTEVFDRGDDFDPRIDPIVRVEAGRLRAKLEQYYADEGIDEPIRIRYPKGGYVPVFEQGGGDTAASLPTSFQRFGPRFLMGIAVVALIASAVLLWPPQREAAGADPTAATPVGGIVRLAVLPLQDFGEPSQPRLAEIVTEALITELAKISDLEVRSRTTVMAYDGVARPISEIARELAVDVIVEGGVVPSAGEVLLKIRLVDAVRDAKLWAESYSSSREEIVALQQTVAADIAEVLKAAARQNALARPRNPSTCG